MKRLGLGIAALGALGLLYALFLLDGQADKSPQVHEARASTPAPDVGMPESLSSPNKSYDTPDRQLSPSPSQESGSRANDSRANLIISLRHEGTSTPAEGVEVFVVPASPSGALKITRATSPGPAKPLELVESDAEGMLSFLIPIGTPMSLKTNDPHGVFVPQDFDVPSLSDLETRRMDLGLSTQATGLYVGLVTNSEGTRIPNARVLVEDGSKIGGEYRVHGEGATDLQGRFELRGKLYRRYLRVSAPGYAATLAPMDTPATKAGNANEIILNRAAEIRGKLWSDPQIPLHIEIETASADMAFPVKLASLINSGPLLQSTQTSSDGSFQLASLKPDVPLQVSVSNEDGERLLARTITLQPGEVRDVQWSATGCTLVVTVTKAKKPLPNREVWLTPARGDSPSTYFDRTQPSARRAETDSLGQCTFKQVHAGPWWVGPAPQEADCAIGTRVLVREGDHSLLTAITVQSGLLICGTVHTPDGAPANRVQVQCQDQAGSWLPPARTDRDGRFCLGPVPAGAYRLRADARAGHADSSLITAEAGDLDVLLQLTAGCQLTGLVRNDLGEVESRCEIRLIDLVGPDSAAAYSRRTYTKSDGTYRLIGIRPGAYTLLAVTKSGQLCAKKNITLAAAVPEYLELRTATHSTVMLQKEAASRPLRYAIYSDGLAVASGIARDHPVAHGVFSGEVSVIVEEGDSLSRELHHDVALGTEVLIELPGGAVDGDG